MCVIATCAVTPALSQEEAGAPEGCVEAASYPRVVPLQSQPCLPYLSPVSYCASYPNRDSV